MMTAVAGCGHTPPQPIIRRVTVQGVRSVDSGALIDGLETRRTGWWPFAEKHYYDPAALDRDVRRIEAYLARHGFFSARISGRNVTEQSDGKKVDVLLTVDEGPPTLVGGVEVRGLDHIDAGLAARMRAGLGLVAGERFDHARYTAAQARLTEQLIAAGHAYAKAGGRVEVDRARRSAAIHLEVAPGPLVRFGEVTIEGYGNIPEDKLRRLVTWRRGDVYHPDELARTRARFFNQRLFASVRVDLPKQPVEVAPVRIRVLPTKLRELRLGVGFGLESKRQEVRVTGRYTIRNFLGGMRTLELRLQPSYVVFPTVWSAVAHGPGMIAEAKVTQPDLWASGISVFGALGYELGIDEGYQYHGPKLQLGGERAFWRERLRAGLSWNFQILDFFNINTSVFDASGTALGKGFRDPYRLAWFEEFAQIDLRDRIVDPRLGGWAEVRLEQGFPQIGGAFTYVKVVPDVRGYLPLGTKRLVLALRVQFGYLLPVGGGDEDSPITRRLALGGPNSHRGFSYNRLAPQRQDVPYKGNTSLLGSADLRWQMFRLFDNWLSLVGFADAGDVVGSLDKLSLRDLHLAVGGSLQYQTPIGAIRIGMGVRLNRLNGTPCLVAQQGADPGTGPCVEPANPDPGARLSFHLTLGEAF